MNSSILLAAVSGGADSLALLYFLRESGQRVVVAHFNHQLRPEADADEAFVRQTAEILNLPFLRGSTDVAAFAQQQHLSLEEAARKLRYRFLFHAARQAAAQAVVTGHTADDQAETVLMHFLRGAGLPGLKGMTPRTLLPAFDPQIPLLRPLLGWTRAQTEDYCHARGLVYRTDSSNTDTAYLRNRLRHELLPLLETYNPQIRQTLAKTATLLQEEEELLFQMTDSTWERVAVRAESGFVQFDLMQLEQLSPALRRRLFRKAAFSLRPALRDVDFSALERAASLQPETLAGGLKTFLEGESLYLAESASALPVDVAQVHGQWTVENGQTYDLGNGWSLTSKIMPAQFSFSTANSPFSDNFSAALDTGLIGDKLQLRAPHPGEHFEPLGMPGKTVKLSDLFINLKIPKRLRKNWPLICVETEIAWIPGLRMAEKFRVTEKTLRVTQLKLERQIKK
ncbi:MAG: tRNA lysidine(34) synthetase TilS [Anaerolineae bacterium CG_4_9_14_3_um_filter_57_17]|nr:tRNA lysidine(34) synthetase TilS [bacterium]NCT21242.1 tRNA lysidine(34) synthetase TilS [bacterium]PJB64439.1 MAG: tRNA lysidine(34) synthetase TilS [Anaerolineae bacterium CG_4_9_14_3_um_filter_57_17]